MDDILKAFQEITRKDVAECTRILELFQWDLEQAINFSLTSDNACDSDSFNEASSISNLNEDNQPTSARTSNEFQFDDKTTFKVKYDNEIFTYYIKSSAKVSYLKCLVSKDIGIPVSNLDILGLQGRTDKDLLDFACNPVNLIVHASHGFRSQRNISNPNIKEVNVSIHGPCEIVVSYPASKTIAEVKYDYSNISGIPSRKLSWNGWPIVASDSNTLSDLKVSEIELFVTNTDTECGPNFYGAETETSDSSEDDVIVMDEPSSTRRNDSVLGSLLSSSAEDNLETQQSIMVKFQSQFGPVHPILFLGSLHDAYQNSCMLPPSERRLLVLYIHHNQSISSNVFAKNVLCSESICNLLDNNFIVWAWDATLPENMRTLERTIQSVLGVSVVQSCRIDHYPLLVIFSRSRSTTELMQVLRAGNTILTVDYVIENLMQCLETFSRRKQTEIEEEQERAARSAVLQQQDAAYQASLRNDRAKLNETKKRQKAEQAQRQADANLKAVAKRQKEEAERSLGEEPPENCQKPVVSFRMRVPGNVFERRFYLSDSVGAIIKFLESKGLPSSQYRIVTTHPRQDISDLPSSQTFQQCGLTGKLVLNVEER